MDALRALAVILLLGALAWALYCLLPKAFSRYDYVRVDDPRQIDEDARDKLIMHSVGYALITLVGVAWLFDLWTTREVVGLLLWAGLAWALYRVLPKVFDSYDPKRPAAPESGDAPQVRLMMHSLGFGMIIAFGLSWLFNELR